MNQYNIHTLTIEELKDLIASGDDSKANQLRIKTDGTVFLSTIVGMDCLDDIVGRFETFQANNGYVGPERANDTMYIYSLFLTLKDWIANPRTFIDIWVNI